MMKTKGLTDQMRRLLENHLVDQIPGAERAEVCIPVAVDLHRSSKDTFNISVKTPDGIENGEEWMKEVRVGDTMTLEGFYFTFKILN
jgi:hypothetical protein